MNIGDKVKFPPVTEPMLDRIGIMKAKYRDNTKSLIGTDVGYVYIKESEFGFPYNWFV